MNKFTELMKLMEEEEPEQADAIVWLQGDKLDRLEKVVELCIKPLAANIIISGNSTNSHYDDFVSLEAMVEGVLADLSTSSTPLSLRILVDQEAKNTYEHPEGVLSIAREMGWKRLLLVTSLYHQPRAFLAFLPHLQPDEVIINQPWKGISFRERKAWHRGELPHVHADEWKKINQHAGMALATIDEGIAYINNRINRGQ